jgi:hypothetical protein
VFDRQGNIFYSFPINPAYWSVGFSSSFDQNSYTKSLKEIPINNSDIVSMNDLKRNDSLYTITGPHPSVCYQLPDIPVSCCWIDFNRSLEKLQLVFISGTGEDFPIVFHVENNNLINLNRFIQETRMKSVYFYFLIPLRDGSNTLPDSSFVIKQLHFYALPVNLSVK